MDLVLRHCDCRKRYVMARRLTGRHLGVTSSEQSHSFSRRCLADESPALHEKSLETLSGKAKGVSGTRECWAPATCAKEWIPVRMVAFLRSFSRRAPEMNIVASTSRAGVRDRFRAEFGAQVEAGGESKRGRGAGTAEGIDAATAVPAVRLALESALHNARSIADVERSRMRALRKCAEIMEGQFAIANRPMQPAAAAPTGSAGTATAELRRPGSTGLKSGGALSEAASSGPPRDRPVRTERHSIEAEAESHWAFVSDLLRECVEATTSLRGLERVVQGSELIRLGMRILTLSKGALRAPEGSSWEGGAGEKGKVDAEWAIGPGRKARWPGDLMKTQGEHTSHQSMLRPAEHTL